VRGWFWSRKPATPAPVTIAPEDRLIAAWWGYTPEQWVALPHDVQREKRDTVTWARTA